MRVLGGAVLIAVALVTLLGAVATDRPDGLERVIADHALAEGTRPVAPAPLEDYETPGTDGHGATVLAALGGIVTCAAAAWLVVRAAAGPSPDPRASGSDCSGPFTPPG